MYLPVTPLNSQRFTLIRDEMLFFADQVEFPGVNFFSAIFDDAPDLGFAMLLPESGRVEYFRFVGPLYEDHIKVAWQFKSVNEALAIKARIYLD